MNSKIYKNPSSQSEREFDKCMHVSNTTYISYILFYITSFYGARIVKFFPLMAIYTPIFTVPFTVR